MYYVTKNGQNATLNGMGFDTYGAARLFAEQRYKETGNHYHVLELKTVWTTKTLAMAKG